MNTTLYNVSDAWKQELAKPGLYEHHCETIEEVKKIRKLGRVWKRIFRATEIECPAQIFELGCGGGIHLSSLALNGFQVHGIDVSEDVIRRAKVFLSEVSRFQQISATVEIADILNYESTGNTYDMCFHFGVVEHFISPDERITIWNNLKRLTKPGGWIVSVVPCGQNFMRQLIREKKIAGYNIPEIDYSCDSHTAEFKSIGLVSIKVFTHSYFSFLKYHPSNLLSKVAYKPLFLAGNVLLPFLPFPDRMTEKWAQSLIVVGKKPD